MGWELSGAWDSYYPLESGFVHRLDHRQNVFHWRAGLHVVAGTTDVTAIAAEGFEASPGFLSYIIGAAEG
jgi:hypothetical protein